MSEHLSRSEEVLAENRFLAARDGIDARVIDTTSESLRPIKNILDELLDAARQHAAALGCLNELERVGALVTVPGAARQRAYPRGEDGLVRLVADLVGMFTK